MSLTLQMSAGVDNLSVWCIRMKSEGTNQVSNGTFDSGTDWTANDDWKIQNGAAEYTFVSVANGILDQTLASSVDAVPYILEYEITSLTSGTFILSLIGGGTRIVAASVTLPITLGQHRLIIQGVSGKSLLRFQVGSFGSLEAMFIDNVKLRKLEVTTYIATETLSLDNTYDGQVLEFNDRLSDINEFMDIQSSGSIGGVSSYTFTVARYNSNATFNSWFEEFYPTYDGATLISRECEIGVVWNTATTDTEITWLMRGKIVDYQFESRKMIITVLQSTEIDSRPLPYYQVQKDFDNEVSYFINAPDENYGISLPIVYGDFTISIDQLLSDGNDPLFHRLLSPVVNVDKHKLKYIVATHEMNEDAFNTSGGGASFFWKYLDSLNVYMSMSCTNGSSTNDVIKAFVQNFDSLNNTGNIILGTINVVPTLPGSNNDSSDYSNLTNVKVSNEDELTITSTNEVALMVDGNFGSDVGAIGTGDGDISILVFQSDSVAADASDDTIITLFNPAFNKSAGGYGALTEFGWNTGEGDKLHTRKIDADTTARDVTDESWTIEQVLNFQFVIRSKSSYTNKYKMMWLRLQNIVVTDARKKIKFVGGGAA